MTIFSDCQHALSLVSSQGTALFKFISPNDLGLTGSHQSGFYLPRRFWRIFAPSQPTKGENDETDVTVLWQDGAETRSKIKWYGRAKNEYRLTRFGRDFPFCSPNRLGDLFILVPLAPNVFRVFILHSEEDISEIRSVLGVELLAGQTAAIEGGHIMEESDDEKLEIALREVLAGLEQFPPGKYLAERTRAALAVSIPGLIHKSPDYRLMKWVSAEYHLFRLLEQKFCLPRILKGFSTIETFIEMANTVLNRRKSRAGRSLEEHVGQILTESKIPFSARPPIDGEPDIVIPGIREYEDETFPPERLFVVAVKTTCKDRWRQVLEEGKRVPSKHVITLQRGITENQIESMNKANVQLVVPKELHSSYPKMGRKVLLTLEEFVKDVQTRLGI